MSRWSSTCGQAASGTREKAEGGEPRALLDPHDVAGSILRPSARGDAPGANAMDSEDDDNCPNRIGPSNRAVRG